MDEILANAFPLPFDRALLLVNLHVLLDVHECDCIDVEVRRRMRLEQVSLH